MTKHLESLRVQNFRCFKDFTAEKLGDVNLIVGKNNSGKSSLLEAVWLCADKDNGLILTNLSNLKDEITNNQNLDFVKNFYYNREIKEQEIVISSINPTQKYVSIQYGYIDRNDNFHQQLPNDPLLQVKFTPIITFKNALKETTGQIYISNKSDALNNHKSEGFSFSQNFHHSGAYLNVSVVSTGDINFNSLSYLFDMIQIYSEYKKNIIDVLKTIEPTIEDFGFFDRQGFSMLGSKRDSKSRFVQLRLSNGQLVPMKSMGDGIATIFNILINAYNAKDGILLIDEVENGLHYSVQKQVWQVLFDLSKKLNMQIFATTHSWDAIESFAEVAKENTGLEGILMRMGRSALPENENEIIASIYEEEELYNIVQKQRELR